MLVQIRALSTVLEVFRKATNNIGTEAVPHQMRHSGPSLDFAQGVRHITCCQKRGRWATMTSLKRYEKHGVSTTRGGFFRRRPRHAVSRASTTPRATFRRERHVLSHRDWPDELTASRRNFGPSLKSPAPPACSVPGSTLAAPSFPPLTGGPSSGTDFASTTSLAFLYRSRVAATLLVRSVRSLRSPATCVCPQPSSSVAVPRRT